MLFHRITQYNQVLRCVDVFRDFRNQMRETGRRMNFEYPSMNDAVLCYEAGKTDEAEAICRRVLQTEPANANALHLLGGISLRRKSCEEAADFVLQAIAINKHSAEFHNNLGNIYKAWGKPDLAEKCFREALRLQPRYADAIANLGSLLIGSGRYPEATDAYEKALEVEPDRSDFHYMLGLILTAMSKPEQGVWHYHEALRLQPESTEILSRMAEAYKNMGRLNKAAAVGLEAVKLDAGNVRALLILGDIYESLNRYENAVVYYKQALNVAPDSVYAHRRLGSTLQRMCKTAEARSHSRKAVKLDPADLLAKLENCIIQIPFMCRSTDEIVQSRENYRKALEELCQSIDLTDPATLDKAGMLVGSDHPFYLAYQGENDRELQSMYGVLVARIQAACYPEWAQKQPSPPPLKLGEPIRVGILSGFFRSHSVWRIPVKGWIENLNREEFQLYGYHTGVTTDAQTETAKKYFYRFTEKLPTMKDWLKLITGDRLHVLIIPEVGMDPMTLRLAAFRLSPVQCTSVGHPETTGLPTMDYFLSSDLMEPEDGQEHYSEKLVRLPNLSVYCEPMADSVAPGTIASRADFGLRDDIPLFLCTQSIFTRLPQHDEVFPRIALETGACRFVFIDDAKSSLPGKFLMRRLETAFSRFNLRCEDYVSILPQLAPARYHTLNQLADVFLNSMGWSAFNTAMEALTCNLPIIDLPGKLMRSRHTHGILKMMRLDDTGCRNMDEYVAIAALLAKEPDRRRELSEKIARNRHLVYRDVKCIRGLEEFLRSATAQAMEQF